MSETVKVGDVWAIIPEEPRKNVVKVSGGLVGYWGLTDTGLMLCGDMAPEAFAHRYTLIERDGQPVREFEDGVYYAVRVKLNTGQRPKDVGMYKKCLKRFMLLQYKSSECELGTYALESLVVGEPLRVQWPACTVTKKEI